MKEQVSQALGTSMVLLEHLETLTNLEIGSPEFLQLWEDGYLLDIESGEVKVKLSTDAIYNWLVDNLPEGEYHWGSETIVVAKTSLSSRSN